MNLDQDLRRALRREEPSDGFADRVLAGVSQGSGSKPGRRGGITRWMAIGVAASLAIGIGVGTVRYRERQQEIARTERGVRAARDVERALRITSDKLYEIQVKLAATSEGRGVQ